MDNYLFKSKIDIRFMHATGGGWRINSPGEDSLNTVIMNGAKGSKVVVDENNVIFLSPYTLFLAGRNSLIDLEVPEGGSAIALLFDYVGKYCDQKICAFLETKESVFVNSTSILPMDDGIKGYFTTMDTSLSGLFEEIPFREIKYKEFFYILCNLLKVSDFAEFLHPAMSWYDPVFRRKVMDNYQKSYRVKTLAADCGYSEKEFVEKFKEEFGILPCKWINDQVHQAIVKKLSNPCSCFKEIANDLQMSSVQSFSRFCKKNFGITPTQLRQQLIEK